MTKNQRQTQKWSSRIREPENSRIEKTAKPKNWQKKRQLSQCISLPFGRIYHVFYKLHSTTRLAKEFYHFVHIFSPFGNELIYHKLREVDAMHEIKISVLHKLDHQIFKSTMLNKVSRLAKMRVNPHK
jgi:hypothetical protein